MQKRKFTSWGVSFASLALVAGMMSYMGISNKDDTSKTTTTAQTQVTEQSSTQSSTQSGNSSISYQLPNESSNSDSQQSDSQTISQDESFSQHGEFDTTTGGT
jgi:hypothetical protein